MSGSLGYLNIQLSLDQAKFQSNLTNAQKKAKQFSERTTAYLNNIEKAAVSLNKTNSRLFNFGVTKTFAQPLLQYADSYTELNNKIKLVTETERERVAALQSVYDISLKTAQSTQATSTVYQTFAQNAKELGLAQSDVARLTETVSKAVAVSGASTATASNALVQFSQSLLMGKLKAQEFNSLMTQTPSVIQAIASGLGITTAQLKAMVDKGEMSAAKMIEGLKKAEKSVDGLYQKTTTTLSGAMQNLSTVTEKWIGETNKAVGVSEFFAKTLNVVADNMAVLAPLTLGVASGIAGMKLSLAAKEALLNAKATYEQAKATRDQAKAIIQKTTAKKAEIATELQAVQAYIADLQAQLNLAQTEKTRALLSLELQRQTSRETALINAQTAATQRLVAAKRAANAFSGAMAALGGPVGIAAFAISAAIPLLLTWGSSAENAAKKSNDYANSLDNIKQSMEQLSTAQLEDKLLDAKYAIEEQRKKVAELEQQYKTFQHVARTTVQEITWTDIDGITHIQQIKRSAEEMAKAEEKATRAKAKLEAATKSLNEQIDVQSQLQARLKQKVEQSQKGIERYALTLNDWDKANQDIDKQLQSLSEEVDVLTLKSQGNAKAAFILSGLYKVLKVEGADYAKVLAAIANGQYASAEAANKTIDMSLEDLQKIFDAKERLEKAFELDNQKTTLTKQIQLNTKPTKSKTGGENARKNWLDFYDELRAKSRSSLGEIDLEQTRMFQRLEEHMKKGVVSHTEYEAAKLAISQRFAKQRQELAAQYAPELGLKNKLDEDFALIRELQQAAEINPQQAARAIDVARLNYAQGMAQQAVDPLAQLRGQFDPNQELLNRQAQELALVNAFYADKEGLEEEHQARIADIKAKYRNEMQQRELDYYAQSANIMSGAFDTMAGVMANAAGEQSALYKAMFVASKAFAVAESIIKIQQGIANAAALPFPQNLPAMVSVAAATANIISTIQSVTMGFATGGYTGDGGKYTPAGIVHRGEYVITKEATSRLGRGFLDSLNYGIPRRGFANGGGVGVPNVPMLNYHPQTAAPNVKVTVINNGQPAVADVRQAQRGNELDITVELLAQMDRIADQRYRKNQQNDLRSGGVFAR